MIYWERVEFWEGEPTTGMVLRNRVRVQGPLWVLTTVAKSSIPSAVHNGLR